MRTTRSDEQSGFFGNARRFVRISAEALKEWQRARADYRDLAHASDRLLKDIGLTRQQAGFARSRVSFAGILRDMLREEKANKAKQEAEKGREPDSGCTAVKKCCSQAC